MWGKGRSLLLLLTKREQPALQANIEPPPVWVVSSRKAYRQFESRKGRLLNYFIIYNNNKNKENTNKYIDIEYSISIYPPSSFVYALGKAAKSYGEIRYVNQQ